MKLKAQEIVSGVYQIGGAGISTAEDAAVYLIDFAGEQAMVDSGAGRSFALLVNNIEELGFSPEKISHLILTHCHIDHIGSAPFFKKQHGTKLVIHELDAPAMETGDPAKTAADWYGAEFPPTKVDEKIKGPDGILKYGNDTLKWLHTPGHTPGSISLYLDREGKRVLFGQDIHGPFNKAFGSDINLWKISMRKLLDLNADILCEGHFGVYHPKEKVKDYIERYLEEYE